jgi:hypothetical protein
VREIRRKRTTVALAAASSAFGCAFFGKRAGVAKADRARHIPIRQLGGRGDGQRAAGAPMANGMAGSEERETPVGKGPWSIRRLVSGSARRCSTAASRPPTCDRDRLRGQSQMPSLRARAWMPLTIL